MRLTGVVKIFDIEPGNLVLYLFIFILSFILINIANLLDKLQLSILEEISLIRSPNLLDPLEHVQPKTL